MLIFTVGCERISPSFRGPGLESEGFGKTQGIWLAQKLGMTLVSGLAEFTVLADVSYYYYYYILTTTY